MTPQERWEANPDRGVDGMLHTPHLTVGAVQEQEDGMVAVWTGPREGRAPVRVHDPSGGDPAVVAVAFLAGGTEAGR